MLRTFLRNELNECNDCMCAYEMHTGCFGEEQVYYTQGQQDAFFAVEEWIKELQRKMECIETDDKNGIKRQAELKELEILAKLRLCCPENTNI